MRKILKGEDAFQIGGSAACRSDTFETNHAQRLQKIAPSWLPIEEVFCEQELDQLLRKFILEFIR